MTGARDGTFPLPATTGVSCWVVSSSVSSSSVSAALVVGDGDVRLRSLSFVVLSSFVRRLCRTQRWPFVHSKVRLFISKVRQSEGRLRRRQYLGHHGKCLFSRTWRIVSRAIQFAKSLILRTRTRGEDRNRHDIHALGSEVRRRCLVRGSP